MSETESTSIEATNDKQILNFKCPLCEYTCQNSSNLKKHIVRRHTGKKPYSCSKCEYTSNDSSNLKKHIIKHDEESSKNRYLAPGFVLYEETDEQTDPRGKCFACTLCEYKCYKESNMKRHSTSHTGNTPYSCDVCDYKSLNQANLTKHMKIHDDSVYNCDRCSYSTKDASNLRKHFRTHSEYKPYTCTFCDFNTASPAYLKSHLKIHNGDKRFLCVHCDYKCIRTNELKRHMSRHHPGKPYSYKTPDQDDFKHKNWPKEFPCNICNRKLSSAFRLKTHLKLHRCENSSGYGSDVMDTNLDNNILDNNIMDTNLVDDQNLFSCTMCHFKTSIENMLQIHVETHTEHYLQNFNHFLDCETKNGKPENSKV